MLEVPFTPALREASVLCCGGTLLTARIALDEFEPTPQGSLQVGDELLMTLENVDHKGASYPASDLFFSEFLSERYEHAAEVAGLQAWKLK